jgi:translation initiation factor IF-2
MPAPQTRGDMQTLQQAAPFLRATSQLSPEDRWLIEQMRDRTKRRGQDVVAGTADKNRDERARSSDERIELGYAQIDAGLQRAQKMIDAAYGRQSIGHGQNMELEALKLKVQEFTKRRAAQTSLLNSINNLADEPRVKEQLKADSMKSLESDWNDLEKELNTLQTRKSGAAPKTSVQTTRTSKGGGTAGANPVVKKVRVKNKKTGATGLMPENSPNLKPGGDYERI